MGGLVQPPPAARAHRQPAAGRSRGALLRSDGGACPSRVVQAKTPPRNPARFSQPLGLVLPASWAGPASLLGWSCQPLGLVLPASWAGPASLLGWSCQPLGL